MGEKMDKILLSEDSLMYEYLRHDIVKRLLDEHKKRLNDNHKILFSLVVFEKWLRNARSLNY